jgi:hypothetical protein
MNSNYFGAYCKHKSSMAKIKLKRELKKCNIRRYMSIIMAFELYNFQAILNWRNSPFQSSYNKYSMQES